MSLLESPVPGSSYDVAVVGAGPGGALCARRLARTGARVALLDRSAPPRYKTCGGGLIWRARKELGIELGGAIECEIHTAVLNLLDDDLRFRITRPQPIVTMTMRSELDRRLADAATEAGARLLAPVSVVGIAQGRGWVELDTDRGTVRAAFVVAADGAAGRIGRWAGIADTRRLIPALETELRVEAALRRRFATSARFDFGPATAGYAWVFPKRHHLSVGCLSTRAGSRTLRRELETYLQRLGLDRPLRRDDHGFVIPIRPMRFPARGRVLVVGDAAGLADPVTCEGISAAIDSGRHAATSILSRFNDPDAVRRQYLHALRHRLLPELRRAGLFARALYGPPALRRLAFRRLGQPLCEAIAAIMMGERTYRGLAASPGDYLRLASLLAMGGKRR